MLLKAFRVYLFITLILLGFNFSTCAGTECSMDIEYSDNLYTISEFSDGELLGETKPCEDNIEVKSEEYLQPSVRLIRVPSKCLKSKGARKNNKDSMYRKKNEQKVYKKQKKESTNKKISLNFCESPQDTIKDTQQLPEGVFKKGTIYDDRLYLNSQGTLSPVVMLPNSRSASIYSNHKSFENLINEDSYGYTIESKIKSGSDTDILDYKCLESKDSKSDFCELFFVERMLYHNKDD